MVQVNFYCESCVCQRKLVCYVYGAENKLRNYGEL